MKNWKILMGLGLMVLLTFLSSCDLFTTGQGYVLHVFNETQYKVQVTVDGETAGEVEAQSNKEFGEFTQSAASEWEARDTEGNNLVWRETQDTTTANSYEWYLRIE